MIKQIITTIITDDETGVTLSKESIELTRSSKILEENLRMKKCSVAGIYYCTTHYNIFGHQIGNTIPTIAQIAKVNKSYDQYDYVTNPISVKSDFAVFDGEKRLVVHQNRLWPIEFTVIDDEYQTADALDSFAVNNTQHKKNIKDYIRLYVVKDNNHNYQLLDQLITEYANIPISTIYSLCKGYIEAPIFHTTKNIRDGKALLTEKEIQKAETSLKFVATNQKLFNLIREKGHNVTKYSILGFCISVPGLDIKRFIDKLKDCIEHDQLSPMTDIDLSLKELSNMYNKGKKSRKIDFVKYYTEHKPKNVWLITDKRR